MKTLFRRNSKVCITVVIVVVLASFVGYGCWSMLSMISNTADFSETLQKDGFTIIQATDGPFPSFGWWPPPNIITCQNQTQFIQEALSLNATGQLLGNQDAERACLLYQLDFFHFYAVTSDTMFAYGYTPPGPSSLDALIIAPFSSLAGLALAVAFIIAFVGLIIIISISIAYHIDNRETKNLTR